MHIIIHYRNYMVATTTISHLLILDLKRDSKNKIMYPFTLHTPQHPFISILIRDKRSWQTVLSQITFIMNHQDYRYVRIEIYIYICIYNCSAYFYI